MMGVNYMVCRSENYSDRNAVSHSALCRINYRSVFIMTKAGTGNQSMNQSHTARSCHLYKCYPCSLTCHFISIKLVTYQICIQNYACRRTKNSVGVLRSVHLPHDCGSIFIIILTNIAMRN